MAAKMKEDVENLAPQKILGTFQRNSILLFFVVSILAHVVVIGGTSLDYLYFEWVNPEAGLARKKAVEDAKKQERKKKEMELERIAAAEAAAAAARASNATATATNTVAAAPAAKTTEIAGIASPDEKGLLEKHKDAPIVKQITAVAASNEIPRIPNEAGIPIDQTNP